ncbi:MAG: cytidylate kinase-like family protein, partial [bacterium]
MNQYSIVIDREYGSGGREVARLLSEKLGIEFYDGNLLVLAGKEYGIDLKTLKDYDEKGVSSGLWDLSIGRSSAYGSLVNEAPYEVFSAQSRLVQQLVAKSPCIFLGRC